MKTVSSGMALHLAGSVTSIGLCWSMTRVDGAQFFFTQHDADLVISGQTYKSNVGFTAGSIETGSTGKIDNLEVTGFLNSVGIDVDDLKKRLFDYAMVFLFAVNWADLSMGIVRLRRGRLGEVSRDQDLGFKTELRGLTQNLVQETGDIWSPICRNDLGDAKCQIPIAPGPWQSSFAYNVGDTVSPATKSSDALLTAIFKAQAVTGPSGSTEPTWNTTVGATTTDGGVTWLAIPPFRMIGSVVTPIDSHNFIANTLAYPASVSTTTATVSFVDNVSKGTTLTFSDGAGHTSGNDFTSDTLGSDAWAAVLHALETSGLDFTITIPAPLVIQITNTSGFPGSIEKTGDVLNGIKINDFGSAILDAGTLTWLTGANAGISMEIKTTNPSTNQVTMWLGMVGPIEGGDRYLYYPGCAKNRDDCIKKFDNILNMRAEPDMPGTDGMLNYPDSTPA